MNILVFVNSVSRAICESSSKWLEFLYVFETVVNQVYSYLVDSVY